jgi:DNA-binding NarL/FixJ family response regulator
MQLPAPTLAAFSDSLLVLSRLPASVSPQRLMAEGLGALRRIVPFDAAWWGEASGGIDGLAPRNWLSGRMNLPPGFANEWNAIGATDRFALESMRRLDAVVSSTGFEDPEPGVEAFARKHDLYDVIAITRMLPGSGLLQFISLYRHEASARFTAAQRLLFEHFSAHLMQRFVYMGARFGALLQQLFPDWTAAALPAQLVEATRQLPVEVSIGRRRFSARACGELMLLNFAAQRRAPVLAPRELNVALMYADGRSHKEIARQTGLSPATVRTYLREAYRRLGVSDKVKLGLALEEARQRHRRT